MGRLNFIDGHSRRELFSRVTSQATQGSSVDFGATGLTFRTRFGVNSGTWNITSATAIASGGTMLDFVNVGRVADFAIISVDSNTIFTALLLGEPLRGYRLNRSPGF